MTLRVRHKRHGKTGTAVGRRSYYHDPRWDVIKVRWDDGLVTFPSSRNLVFRVPARTSP